MTAFILAAVMVAFAALAAWANLTGRRTPHEDAE